MTLPTSLYVRLVVLKCCRCVPLARGCCAGTVRRFLEHFIDAIDRVAFVVNDPVDEGIYVSLLPLYFPRSEQEETFAIAQLPEDTGNEWGEAVIPERTIRIATIPGHDGSPVADDSVTSACAPLMLRCWLQGRSDDCVLPAIPAHHCVTAVLAHSSCPRGGYIVFA